MRRGPFTGVQLAGIDGELWRLSVCITSVSQDFKNKVHDSGYKKSIEGIQNKWKVLYVSSLVSNPGRSYFEEFSCGLRRDTILSCLASSESIFHSILLTYLEHLERIPGRIIFH